MAAQQPIRNPLLRFGQSTNVLELLGLTVEDFQLGRINQRVLRNLELPGIPFAIMIAIAQQGRIDYDQVPQGMIDIYMNNLRAAANGAFKGIGDFAFKIISDLRIYRNAPPAVNNLLIQQLAAERAVQGQFESLFGSAARFMRVAGFGNAAIDYVANRGINYGANAIAGNMDRLRQIRARMGNGILLRPITNLIDSLDFLVRSIGPRATASVIVAGLGASYMYIIPTIKSNIIRLYEYLKPGITANTAQEIPSEEIPFEGLVNITDEIKQSLETEMISIDENINQIINIELTPERIPDLEDNLLMNPYISAVPTGPTSDASGPPSGVTPEMRQLYEQMRAEELYERMRGIINPNMYGAPPEFGLNPNNYAINFNDIPAGGVSDTVLNSGSQNTGGSSGSQYSMGPAKSPPVSEGPPSRSSSASYPPMGHPYDSVPGVNAQPGKPLPQKMGKVQYFDSQGNVLYFDLEGKVIENKNFKKPAFGVSYVDAYGNTVGNLNYGASETPSYGYKRAERNNLVKTVTQLNNRAKAKYLHSIPDDTKAQVQVQREAVLDRNMPNFNLQSRRLEGIFDPYPVYEPMDDYKRFKLHHRQLNPYDAVFNEDTPFEPIDKYGVYKANQINKKAVY